VLIAQITDPHIKANRKHAYNRVDTASFLETTIQHINAFTPKIDAVIITGDLTDKGSPEEYATIRPILDTLQIPWFVIPGNHDHRSHFLQAFYDQAYLKPDMNFIQYAIEDFPLRLIGLDTTVPNHPHGYLCAERLEWLNTCLQDQPQKPTLIFLHHPPLETGITHMDVQNLSNSRDLFALLKKHQHVRHIACGHVHRAIETCINGIAVSIAPTAHAVTLDMRHSGPAHFTIEPPALRLFRFGDDQNIVSHISFMGNCDGPYPFYASDGSLID